MNIFSAERPGSGRLAIVTRQEPATPGAARGRHPGREESVVGDRDEA